MRADIRRVIGAAGAIDGEEAGQWISVSDLMAGLMMVFLLIAVALMRYALMERDRIKEIAVAYQDTKIAIYEALMKEFEADLERWDARLDGESLEFEFQSPEVLFETGKVELRPKFKEILKEFFPRYVKVLRPFREAIEEVRIEGHTSSVWNRGTPKDLAYYLNMELSQGRTRSVLWFVYGLPEVRADREWITRYLVAVGYSSSRLRLKPDGTEDRERSRRVAFRVVTNAEVKIRKILEGG